MRKTRKRLEEERVGIPPRPTPIAVRKRSITLPLNATNAGTRQVTSGQEQSLLFQLPVEVRALIFHACIGGRKIRLERETGEDARDRHAPGRWEPGPRIEQETPKFCLGGHQADGKVSLSLLLTCRRW